jgi:two-component system OmpR family response regulator
MILVVDDDEEVREMIRAILEAEGYRTEGACNGREAFARLRPGHELPAMIICDLLMPLTNGADLLESLTPHEHLRAIPFVFMTGDSELLKAHIGKDGGPKLLPKPLDTDDLLAMVRAHCHRAPAQPRGFSGVWRTLLGSSQPRGSSAVSRGPRR